MRVPTLSLALLCACAPTGAPVLEVSPETLQFPVLEAGAEETLPLLLRNVGDGPLSIEELRVEPAGGAFRFSDATTTLSVSAGEWAAVDVTFSPLTHQDSASLVISAADLGQTTVALEGAGFLPDLALTPAVHDFGDVSLPCMASEPLRLANRGSGPLVVSALDFVAGAGLSFTAQPPHHELPFTLAPSETATLEVVFEPIGEGAVMGNLEITSNDPAGVASATQEGMGTVAAPVTDQFVGPAQPRVDVIVLIDQSCSMEADHATTLTDGATAMFDALDASFDWQLALVNEATGCASPHVLDASTKQAATQFVDHAFGVVVPDVVTEALLSLARTALAQTGAGGCNEGLVRSAALLHLVVVSDEPEQSGIDWSVHLKAMESYVSDPGLVRVSAVADLQARCGGVVPAGAGGYAEAAMATAGELLDICEVDWGPSLGELVEEGSMGAPAGYVLSQTALPDTVEVTVEGATVTDFTYSAVLNHVVLATPPLSGEAVEIRYAPAADCTD